MHALYLAELCRRFNSEVRPEKRFISLTEEVCIVVPTPNTPAVCTCSGYGIFHLELVTNASLYVFRICVRGPL